MKLSFYWHDYNYFQYEKILAVKELESIFGKKPRDKEGHLEISYSSDWIEVAKKTTYFSHVVGPREEIIIPNQAKFESSANGKNKSAIPKISKQSTRYSSHGMHEYKGKYNPQVVRVIGNILGLEAGDWILDPFCGSGTTLVEARHSGWNAIGLDRNPLSIFITNGKIASLSVSNDYLNKCWNSLKYSLGKIANNINFSKPLKKNEQKKLFDVELDNFLPSIDYLRSWFVEDVLYQLSSILYEINKIADKNINLIFQVFLSDIIREVSLQNPSDLRIRRRINLPESIDVFSLFIESAESKIEALSQLNRNLLTNTYQKSILGDVGNAIHDLKSVIENIPDNRIDAVITSPPYATGLPYIDTDRLSLVFFGFISSSEIRATQRSMVGNREITRTERKQLINGIKNNEGNLPDEVISFCMDMQMSLSGSDGFRRQNKPGLIYKYFVDMAKGFRETAALLSKDSPYALIVGKNKTTLGGGGIIIETPKLLAMVANCNGFSTQEIIPLDTYQRFDIHKKNSINSESLILLRSN